MTRKNTFDIYFHMTNHYRKLRNVKSVVNSNLCPKVLDARNRRSTSRRDYTDESDDAESSHIREPR